MENTEFYEGTEALTFKEHYSKCPACRRSNEIIPGSIVPHGQPISKSEYKALFEALDRVKENHDTNSEFLDN